jgi:hypothetical protein
MNCEQLTAPRARLNLPTESMNLCGPENIWSLTPSEAKAILNRIRDGSPAPAHLVDHALRVTGDLT